MHPAPSVARTLVRFRTKSCKRIPFPAASEPVYYLECIEARSCNTFRRALSMTEDSCIQTRLYTHLAASTVRFSFTWAGQSDAKSIYKKMKGLYWLEIPPKTPKIQPLDVFLNRQYKVIAHRVYDLVILDDINIHLAERNNVIRLHSLIHNQLSAPIFVPMIRYAWFKSGYVDANPGQFQTVVDVCFKFHQGHCDTEGCDSFSFIRCSYCDEILCFNYFFINFHSR